MPRKPTSMWRVRMLRKLRPYAKKSRFWRRIAEELEKGPRRRREVNVYHINRLTKEGETVFVPGKVLGTGIIDHPVTVGAFSFSKQAYEKIIKAGGEALLIDEFLEKYPTGSNIKLIG